MQPAAPPGFGNPLFPAMSHPVPPMVHGNLAWQRQQLEQELQRVQVMEQQQQQQQQQQLLQSPLAQWCVQMAQEAEVTRLANATLQAQVHALQTQLAQEDARFTELAASHEEAETKWNAERLQWSAAAQAWQAERQQRDALAAELRLQAEAERLQREEAEKAWQQRDALDVVLRQQAEARGLQQATRIHDLEKEADQWKRLLDHAECKKQEAEDTHTEQVLRLDAERDEACARVAVLETQVAALETAVQEEQSDHRLAVKAASSRAADVERELKKLRTRKEDWDRRVEETQKKHLAQVGQLQSKIAGLEKEVQAFEQFRSSMGVVSTECIKIAMEMSTLKGLYRDNDQRLQSSAEILHDLYRRTNEAEKPQLARLLQLVLSFAAHYKEERDLVKQEDAMTCRIFRSCLSLNRGLILGLCEQRPAFRKKLQTAVDKIQARIDEYTKMEARANQMQLMHTLTTLVNNGAMGVKCEGDIDSPEGMHVIFEPGASSEGATGPPAQQSISVTIAGAEISQ
jgi:hypothetical protein